MPRIVAPAEAAPSTSAACPTRMATGDGTTTTAKLSATAAVAASARDPVPRRTVCAVRVVPAQRLLPRLVRAHALPRVRNGELVTYR